MINLFAQEIGAALVENFAAVVGTLAGAEVQVTPGVPEPGAQWHAEVAVEGTAQGSFILAIDAPSASVLAALATGVEEPATQAVIDTFREICNRVLDSVAAKAAASGASLKLSGISGVGDQDSANGWTAFALTGATLRAAVALAVYTDLQPAEDASARNPERAAAPRPVPAPPPARPAERDTPRRPSEDRMQVILDMDLPLTARFGHTEMPLKALTRIGPGSVIDLARSAEDPVEVLVSNRVVARGEVVIVSGNYAIRIIDVVSPSDRTAVLEE